MSNIQIVTDSTGYISREYIRKHSIKVVPLSVHFNGETRNEGLPGEFDEFFNQLKTSKDFPTTSQPSIDAFRAVFDDAVQKEMEVIAITISSKLSGTYNSASAAARMVSPEHISIIDSETSVANLRELVEAAVEMAQSGNSRNEIVEHLEWQKKRMGIQLTVDTLDYLRKGGRLTVTQAFIGSILNISPIISLVDGKLVPSGKTRGKSKALSMIMDQIPDNVKKISICQILDIQEAESVKEKLNLRFPNVPIVIDEIGPVIGAHLGPKAIGICYLW